MNYAEKLEQNEEMVKHAEASYQDVRTDFLSELRFMVENELMELPQDLKGLWRLMENKRLEYLHQRANRFL